MQEFFSDQIGQSIEWFSSTHIFLLIGFFLSLVFFWIIGPKLRTLKYEKYIRYTLVGLAILFEWRVFEHRILNGSLFRIPLCGIALYGLTYALAFKKEKIFNIVYFYAFGTLLTFFFFDTLWGLDRWDGWTYFGAHAAIGWFAIYGYRVLGFTPLRKDLITSMIWLSGYGLISGYATFKFGGSDELFLMNPPVDFMIIFQEIHQVVYDVVIVLLAALLMLGMYSIIKIAEKSKYKYQSK